jgi:hypothetical protein
MRRALTTLLALSASLIVGAGVAQAVVVDPTAIGNIVHSGINGPYVNYPTDRAHYAGVALVPSTSLATAQVPYVASSGGCDDPALTPDLVLPTTGICYHGGSVLHRNETFAVTWDPLRRYWSGVRSYVEQFLRDVADGSGTLTSPFALTSQYSDTAGRAQNESKYGGGCIDYGNPHHTTNQNTTCVFNGSVQTGPGANYPVNGCTPTGGSYTLYSPGGSGPFTANDVCVTDAQIQSELRTIVQQMQIIKHTQPSYRPMVILPLPPGVEACVGASANLCSANGGVTPPAPTLTTTPDDTTGLPAGDYRIEVTYLTVAGQSVPSTSKTISLIKPSTITVTSPPPAPGATGYYVYVIGPGGSTYAQQPLSAIGSDVLLAQPLASGGPPPPAQPYFCSYHSQIDIGGTVVTYVVQPWTAMTRCDEPDAPGLPANPPPATLARDVGVRLVSPLSQSQLASIVDPRFNGWFAHGGWEINDNGGCQPVGSGLDKVTVGRSGQNPYLLQREFNNAGVIESDPITYFGCAPNVLLTPSFVLPSAVNQGDVVQFDGSTTASTLIVANGSYRWGFGDGTNATGPSVTHAYTKSGRYRVTLTVTDRGGNSRRLSQTIEVLQSNGQPPGGGSGGSTGSSKLHVALQLMPQSLSAVLHQGLAVRVTSNEAADGFATLMIGKSAAKRAHIASGHGSMVVIGRGTVSGIKKGTVGLRVHLSSSVVKKVARLHNITLTLRLVLVGTTGARVTIDSAGHY